MSSRPVLISGIFNDASHRQQIKNEGMKERQLTFVQVPWGAILVGNIKYSWSETQLFWNVLQIDNELFTFLWTTVYYHA
jgi:hypothetical protein